MSRIGSRPRRSKRVVVADFQRIRAILVGPVYHDPLYRGGFFDSDFEYHDEPVLQRRTSKMPRNVAPLVCPIKKGE